MSKTTVTIEVDDETARAYEAMPSEERRKIKMLLGLWLRDWVRKDAPTLQQVMEEAGRYAKSQGLTPEILESLLQEV